MGLLHQSSHKGDYGNCRSSIFCRQDALDDGEPTVSLFCKLNRFILHVILILLWIKFLWCEFTFPILTVEALFSCDWVEFALNAFMLLRLTF